jgi:hypothetical protein
MSKMNQCGKSVSILALIAIATTGISNSAFANMDSTTPESLQLAQASSVGQCRAVKISTPIFKERTATSEALQLVAAEKTVTLAGSSDATGLIPVSTPISGFIYAINLKPCGNTPPPTKELCRRVLRPAEGLTIRRDATSTSAVVGGVGYLGQVTLTTNPATVKRAENRDWVQISAPASGWVSNGLVTENVSNLAICP